MIEDTLNYLRELNMAAITVRIVLAILIGGAALVMMTNQYVYIVFHASDSVRLGAQVISGNVEDSD